jgi:hypothetical protein
MSDWIIDPFVSVGPLTFGAPPSFVRQTLREDPKEFKKGHLPNHVQSYDFAGIHAHYDAAEELEFVEAFVPWRLSYEGVELLRPDTAFVIADLRALGLLVRDDGEGGLRFDEHGFALYAPHERTEGVSSFRHGYDTGAAS